MQPQCHTATRAAAALFDSASLIHETWCVIPGTPSCGSLLTQWGTHTSPVQRRYGYTQVLPDLLGVHPSGPHLLPLLDLPLGELELAAALPALGTSRDGVCVTTERKTGMFTQILKMYSLRY